MKSAVYCEHANEVPQVCPCLPDCYCKSHTCKRTRQADPAPQAHDRLALRELATTAACAVVQPYARLRPGSWELQTSNSFRRIGMHGDGDVLCAVTQRSDNHPDLLAPRGVLEYIVAAQPSVVLALLDQLDGAERLINTQIADIEGRLSRAQAVLTRLGSFIGSLDLVVRGIADEEETRAVRDGIADLTKLMGEMSR
jgi:hypothetical protein